MHLADAYSARRACRHCFLPPWLQSVTRVFAACQAVVLAEEKIRLANAVALPLPNPERTQGWGQWAGAPQGKAAAASTCWHCFPGERETPTGNNTLLRLPV